MPTHKGADVRHASFLLLAALAVALSMVRLAGQNASGAVQAPGTAAAGSVLDGVFTAAQASTGQQVFQKVCSSCHTLAEHTGRKFQAKWSGTTVGEMFDLVSSTMPDGNPGSLTPDEYASVIAYFLKETGYPEGQQELPAQSADLMKIRIESLPDK
jgi:S-disulfanyl-L-cysteine oxidoreductase SoxD